MEKRHICCVHAEYLLPIYGEMAMQIFASYHAGDLLSIKFLYLSVLNYPNKPVCHKILLPYRVYK